MVSTYDETRAPEVLGATITLVVLAAISVCARVAGRKISAANFWWDDWIIFVAMVLDIGLGTGYWVMVSKGHLGRHTVKYGGPVTDEILGTFYKILLAIQILYFSTAVAIKTSLILLYYRIFGVMRWFRWVLAIAWIISALYFIVDLFVAIFECKPVAYYWDFSIKGGTCINENQFYRWNGVANLLIDFMIWSLTLPVIWRLQLNVKQKLQLSCVFLLGLLACVASTIRVVAFNQVNLADVTYTLVPVTYWTTIEQSVGIICACLPTMRPLIMRYSKGSSGATYDPEAAGNQSDTIPLSDYSSSRKGGVMGTRASLETNRKMGFERLPEDIAAAGGKGAPLVTANVTRTASDKLPTPPQGILMQQSLEQRSDRF
ncbi:hypothetical protein ACLMJK_008693 [Lecanora helva]